ncbi:hypothetical protein DERF_010244 [Dermatophagoides farinae]|uniref:Uncharacterized protein n=1 Tax=Dermatophagoides farinae TaxID=6954 RepID=A0A922HVP3_DERFA|nr:hypothetical protein DERF_010244 [Dermatophagoides farinae]
MSSLHEIYRKEFVIQITNAEPNLINTHSTNIINIIKQNQELEIEIKANQIIGYNCNRQNSN